MCQHKILEVFLVVVFSLLFRAFAGTHGFENFGHPVEVHREIQELVYQKILGVRFCVADRANPDMTAVALNDVDAAANHKRG